MIYLFFSVRVQCSENYFNTTCTTLCRPRDDRFGHYTCDERGNKVCRSGWTGESCEKGLKHFKAFIFNDEFIINIFINVIFDI